MSESDALTLLLLAKSLPSVSLALSEASFKLLLPKDSSSSSSSSTFADPEALAVSEA